MSPHPRALSSVVWVSPQLAGLDLSDLAGRGVRRVISNRPDGEDPGQPSAAEVEAAAHAAGMAFVHAPVVGLPDEAAVAAVAAALEDETPTLLFCRSGTRSAMVWAMAMRRLGRGDPDDLRAAAATAGYDLSRLPL